MSVSCRPRIGPTPLLVALALCVLPSAVATQRRYTRVVEDILAAWEDADVVCLGEAHGREFDSELRMALVRHPAFPRTVRVIVVESANPAHQDLLDHFILEGASMTREDLAPIWRDANAAEVWESPVYEAFLRAVREVNLSLPPGQRVRVLGGDSNIDWSKITRAEELVPMANRGQNIRDLIATQVLDRHVKALAIYGAGHCSKTPGGFPGQLAERYGRGRMWSVWPLESADEARKARTVFGLGDEPGYVVVTGSKWASTPAVGLETVDQDLTMGDVADAVVYHGVGPDSVVSADLSALKSKYGAELARRSRLLMEAFKLWQSRGRGDVLPSSNDANLERPLRCRLFVADRGRGRSHEESVARGAPGRARHDGVAHGGGWALRVPTRHRNDRPPGRAHGL